MNHVVAQSIQSEADQHHANWQQDSEGVVIATHAQNNTRYASAGLTRAGGLKPDEKTIFEIGSITKVFTSILLAEAVREKRAGYDDAVSAHLAGLGFAQDSPFHRITLVELATHTSGLPRLPVDLAKGADKENPYVHYDEQRLQKSLVSFRQIQLEDAGKYSYSNYGVGILGYVLTQIYGQSFRDLLKARILEPLEMTSTDVPIRFEDLSESTLQRIATPHLAGRALKHWEFGSLPGAGGMISSSEDLIRFGQAHWDVETPEGLAASLAEVAKPRFEHQGLGWGIEGTSLSHGGGTGGFRTKLEVNPKNKTVRVFMANSAGASEDVTVEGDFVSIEGYWSGVLNKENGKLRLESYISRDGRMLVYSIDQNNVALVSVKSRLKNDDFYFSFPSIPAIFEGHVGDRELSGTMTQGDRDRTVQKLKMEYSEQMPAMLREVVAETMHGDLASLQGYWCGYLGGKKGLFVYVEVTGVGELATIRLYSPDQHNDAIVVSSASLSNRKFKFHSDQIDGRFSGKLAKNGKKIKGLWRQGLLPIPLSLYFSEERPERD